MTKYSSKFLTFTCVEEFIKLAKTNDELCKQINFNGILLLTSFGLIYGEFIPSTDSDNPKTVSEIILQTKDTVMSNLKIQDDDLIGDGSTILLKNAIVKYSSGITLNMEQIMLFSDQIIGFFPIDLNNISKQLLV